MASTQGIICRPIFVSRSGGVIGGSSGSSSGRVRQDIDVKSDAGDRPDEKLGEADNNESTLASPESPSKFPIKKYLLQCLNNYKIYLGKTW